MENQIYRIDLTDNKTAEFYICRTNETQPYKEIREIGLVILGNHIQLDGCLNESELESLIKYLEDCKDYITKYNKASKPKIE